MSEYGWVERVVTKQLSNRALVLVSRFARILKQVNGHVLSLQDPMLAKNVVAEVLAANDERLVAIFDELLVEFHQMVESGDAVAAGNRITLQEGVPISVDTSFASKKIRDTKIIYRGVEV